jgi:TonB family protein
MIIRALAGSILAFALSVLPMVPSAPAYAVQAGGELTADSCVTFGEDGNGGYKLANSCDYPIDVAFCAQPKSDPDQCLRTQGWKREKLTAKGWGLSQIDADGSLDFFACRTPGSVEIMPSGMARCKSAPAVPVMSTAALKNPGAILTDKDYPPSEHSKEGTTRFELLVGPDGKPVSCKTTLSSGYEVLDETACNAFLRRARFSPAKDSNGQPVTGIYKGSVTWKAP